MKNKQEELEKKKARCLKKSKQEIKEGKTYKAKARLLELDSRMKVPLFDITIKGDKAGWHRSVTATVPPESYWTRPVGDEMVRIDDYDGELEITLRNKKIQLPLCDLVDIVDTFLAYSYVQGNIFNQRFIKTKKRK